jgi:hypothetical protein
MRVALVQTIRHRRCADRNYEKGEGGDKDSGVHGSGGVSLLLQVC